MPHGQVAVDARVRLGRAPVELDQPVDRAVQIGRVEAVERLGIGGGLREHLPAQRQVQRAVARLGQRVGDRQVGHRGREQHGAVRLLRPQEAGQVRRLLCVGDVGHKPPHPLGRAAVQLADHERRAVASQDDTRLDQIGAEVDEGADGAALPHGIGDLRLVDPVLERHDEPVRREARRHRPHRLLSVMRLHRQQDGVKLRGQGVRRHGRDAGRELLDRAVDPQAAAVDGGDMVRVAVAQEHGMPVTDEACADRAANGARADHDVVHRTILPKVASRSSAVPLRLQ